MCEQPGMWKVCNSGHPFEIRTREPSFIFFPHCPHAIFFNFGHDTANWCRVTSDRLPQKDKSAAIRPGESATILQMLLSVKPTDWKLLRSILATEWKRCAIANKFSSENKHFIGESIRLQLTFIEIRTNSCGGWKVENPKELRKGHKSQTSALQTSLHWQHTSGATMRSECGLETFVRENQVLM